MEELILEVLKQGTEENKKNGKFPYNLTRLDLSKRMDLALNNLYKEGKIHVGDTINDKYIEVL